MTVAEIQGVVAMYLQREVARFNVSGTGANLLLVAMNNARKYAERKHNWSVCRKKGYLSVTTANEVAWDSPTWFGGGTEKMREGKHWWLRGDTTDTTNKFSTTDSPIKILGHGVKHVVETKQDYEDWGEEFSEMRQLRQDSNWHPMLNQPHGLVRGKWLELYPRPTTTQLLIVDGYAWWPMWTGVDSIGTTVWSFTNVTDIDLTDATVDAVEVLLSGPTPNGVVLIRGSNPNPESFLSGSQNYANVIITTWTLANIVAALDKYLYLGSVSSAGSVVTIALETSGYTMEIRTKDSSNVQIDTFSPTGTETSATTDWWTENAEEYLILRTLVECNRLGHVFVGNKEGNLPSPEKQAEQLLQDLILQDSAGELAGGQIELY